MSSMLEQAIVDAKALKEAAIKNAESAVIDKYQEEVRQAMDSLLEQEEELDLGLDEQEEEGGLSMSVGGDDLGIDAPEAFTDDSDKLCACPDVDEEITIDFDQLRQEMDANEDAGGPEVALGVTEPKGLALEDDDEEIELVQEDLENLIKNVVEDLSVDLHPVGSGTLGTNDAETDQAEDSAIAGMRDDEVAEDEEEHLKAIGDLTDRLDETLSNNKGLKNKFVEAIGKSDSIEETKTIFETLQSTLEANHSEAPKTLNEVAIGRNSSPFLPRKQKVEESVDDVFSKRMRMLAGIKYKN